MQVSHVAAPVRAQIISNLRNAILQGHFQPGQKLVEADLCEMLGVSRPSVREALRQLEAEKLVVITPYKGPSVARIDWEEATQIYEVRSLLEGQAAWLYAKRSTPEQLAEMQAALARFQDAVRRGDDEARLTHTSAYYSVILENCGNVVIREFLGVLHARINFLRARSMSRTGRAKESAAEMKRILDALRARNPERARRACVEHVERACEAAKSSFAAKPAPAKAAKKRGAARKAVRKR
jgi:DNA-binding GntR family transcriptional regulator